MNEEKRLTDEVVIDALNRFAFPKIGHFSYEGNVYKDALDLIHRLQDENELLKQEKQLAYDTVKGYSLTDIEQKAEIERLTKEKSFATHKMMESKAKAVELQKQVDKLTEQHLKLMDEHDEYGNLAVERLIEIEELKAKIKQLTEWKDKLQDTKDELEQQLIDTGFKEYCEENKRLTNENAELQKKIENQKIVITGQTKRIEKEKAENKRLYDEFVRLDDFCATKGCICCVCENKKTCKECAKCGSLATEKCNNFKIDVSKYTRAIERADKLQKQVDKLKEENTELHKEHTTLIAGSILEKQDIAKDLANKIYQGLCIYKNWCKMKDAILWGNESDILKCLINEILGVEIE